MAEIGHVADDENVGMAGQAHVRLHDHASGTIEAHAGGAGQGLAEW